MISSDAVMNIANVINFAATILLIRAIVKDRNTIKGYSVSGSLLTFFAITGFNIGFFMMDNYISFALGLASNTFWALASIFSIKNKMDKKP